MDGGHFESVSSLSDRYQYFSFGSYLDRFGRRDLPELAISRSLASVTAVVAEFFAQGVTVHSGAWHQERFQGEFDGVLPWTVVGVCFRDRVVIGVRDVVVTAIWVFLVGVPETFIAALLCVVLACTGAGALRAGLVSSDDPCGGHDTWGYSGEMHVGWDVTPDWSASWCFVQGSRGMPETP